MVRLSMPMTIVLTIQKKPEIAFEMNVPEEEPVEEGEETTPEEGAPEDGNNGSSFDPWWWLRK